MLDEVKMCPELQAAVRDERCTLAFGPRHRQFGIVMPDEGDPAPEGSWGKSAILVVNMAFYFCPWDGAALPGALNNQLYDTIDDELGLVDFNFGSPLELLPEEFHSDAWWRNREIGPTNPVLDAGWEKPPHVDYSVPEPHPEIPSGYVRPPGKLPHSCTDMARMFEDERVMIAYLPWVREYGIRLLDPKKPVDTQPIEINPIRYCPWCGDRLPASLRDEWQERVRALDLDPKSVDIPDELKSDAWWREAGL